MQGKKGTKTDISEIIRRLVTKSNGCIVWTGAYNKGYGVVWFNGRLRGVHEVMYEYKHGPVPKGFELGHMYNNRCVNDEHVKVMTHKENMLMGSNPLAMKARQVECIRGHSLSGSNLYITSEGRRNCKICRKEYQIQYRKTHDRSIYAKSWECR